MTLASEMNITIRLPIQTLFEGTATQVGAVAPDGAFGIMPNHIDFVTAIVPSVLTLRLRDGSEAIFGLDEGLLIKKGHKVDIVSLRGVHGDDLSTLRETVDARFVQMDEDERQARASLSRLEADMVRRFAELKRPVQ
jgi:F-type H+-transporting ATPase subunit epsilon